MRAILIFMLALSLSFAYTDPPHALVQSHNDALAPSLLPSSCLNRINTSYEKPIACAEAELVAVYPSVDERLSSERASKALWRYAAEHSDQSKTVTDEYGCKSYYHKTFESFSLSSNLTLKWRNSTYMLENITADPVELPASVLQEAEGGNITLILDTEMVFEYSFDKTVGQHVCVNDSCYCQETSYPSETIPLPRSITSNRTYEVEGGSLLHFLSKPVLREQWASDASFEDLVFSDRKFYRALLSRGNETLAQADFYAFNITNDSFGAWSINSSPVSDFVNMSEAENRIDAIPKAVEAGSKSFFYVYVFDASPQGLGWQNVSINLTDDFSNNFSKQFAFANRLLTFANSTAEDGSANISNASVFRPSLAAEEEIHPPMTLAYLGILGMVIFLAIVFNR